MSTISSLFKYGPGSLSGKNFLINGNLKVWQRGGSFQASGYYNCADRWFMRSASAVGGSVSGQRVVGGMLNYLKMNFTGATSSWYMRQHLEDSRALERDTTYTVQLNTHNDVECLLSIQVIVDAGDGGTTPNTTLTNSGGMTLAAGAQHTTYTFTTPSSWDSGPTPETTGKIYVIFSINGASGSIPDGSYRFNSLQLEEGDTATEFEYISHGDTLAACERYYQPNVGIMVVPEYVNYFYAYPTSALLPTTMRVTPTVLNQRTYSTGNSAGIHSQNITAVNSKMVQADPAWSSVSLGSWAIVMANFDAEI